MIAGQGADGSKLTLVQKLPELIEWFLGDKEVELRFVHSPLHMGRLAPEFVFEYWMSGRRISERALSMVIQTELSRMNYAFSLGKIIAGLTALAWANYIQSCEYPDWIRTMASLPKRRPGRPRTKPLKIDFDEKLVNTATPQDTTE